MKEKYCKFCGLELEKNRCTCQDFSESLTINKLYRQTVVCDTCGKKIGIDASFCPYCGVPVYIDGNLGNLQKELKGEFAEDVLEKWGIKKKKEKDIFFTTIKIITAVLSLILIILIGIKIFNPVKEQVEETTILLESETSETETISETIVETTTQPLLELKDKWIRQDGYFYCFDKDGEPVVDDWVEEIDDAGNKKYYYFDTDGRLVVNSWIDGEYYVGADGAMYVDTTTPDGAIVDEDGKVIIDENVEKIAVEHETYVYYEAPNSSETITPSNQKSGSSGIIKGVDENKTYELYIQKLIQLRETISKGNDKCNIIYYCPVIVGSKEKEVDKINTELVNIFSERFKTILKSKVEKYPDIPKSIIVNTIEQKPINSNRFYFIASGKIIPRNGLSEKIKFRFNYDRKSKEISILEIKE